jgi:hypothetical protein
MSHSFSSPSWLSWTFAVAHSEAKLTSTGDEASPSKPTGQMYAYPDLLYISFKHILNNLNDFMDIFKSIRKLYKSKQII